MKVNFYYGWKIAYRAGVFIATKFGVSMRANTQALLIEMIDRRRKDPRNFFTK